jgi:starch-binding outer membrane protein, SusD/RagB family
MKRIIQITLILIFAFFINSCADFVEIEPEGVGTLDNIVKDATSSVQAVNGALEPIRKLYKIDMQMLFYFCSDDGYSTRTSDNNSTLWQELNYNERDMGVVWNNFYKVVNIANIIIERLPEKEFKASEQNIKNIVLGQAYFIRAFSYFHLVRCFGDVPLIISELETPDDSKVPRTDIVTIFEQIVADLQNAISYLPESMTGKFGLEFGKPDIYAAHALLADVYLTFEKFTEAAQQADIIISSGKFSSMPREKVFHNNISLDYNSYYQKEVIWDINYDLPKFGQTFTRRMSNSKYNDGTGSVGSFGITEDLTSIFDTVNDLRLKSYIQYDFGRYWIKKYWNGDQLILPTEQYINFPIYRYSEILLIKAEAALSGAGGNASDPLNQVRASAGLPPIQNPTIQDVWKERRIELCFELKRFFDLNRTDRLISNVVNKLPANSAQNAMKHFITSPITGKKVFLFPIPQEEINANPYINENNPGY